MKIVQIHLSPSPLSPLIYLLAWSIHSQGFNVPIFKDRRDERIPRILCISPMFWPWHTWCHFSPGGVAVESSRPSCTCFTWWSLRFCGAESKGPWVVLAFLPFFHLPVPSDPNDPSAETCLGFPGFHSWTSSWSLSKKSGSQWWDCYYCSMNVYDNEVPRLYLWLYVSLCCFKVPECISLIGSSPLSSLWRLVAQSGRPSIRNWLKAGHLNSGERRSEQRWISDHTSRTRYQTWQSSIELNNWCP